jgi:hypothetical protein
MTSPKQASPPPDHTSATERKLAAGLAQIRSELSAQLAEDFQSAIAEIRREYDRPRQNQPAPPVIKVASEPDRGPVALTDVPPVRPQRSGRQVREPQALEPQATPFRVLLHQAVTGRNVWYVLAILLAVALIAFVAGLMVKGSLAAVPAVSRSQSGGAGAAAPERAAQERERGAALPASRLDATSIAEAVQHIRQSETIWLEKFERRQLTRQMADLTDVALLGVREAIQRYHQRTQSPQDDVRILSALLQHGLNRRAPVDLLQVDGLMSIEEGGLPGGLTGRAFTDYLTKVYLPERKLADLDVSGLLKAVAGPNPILTLSRAVVHDGIDR